MPFPLVSREKYEELLAKADKNKDAQIDQEEYLNLTVSLFRAAFDSMDINKDGQISLDEFKAANTEIPAEEAEQMFSSFDGNQDG